MRVAVLGNGPSLLRHRYGVQIDACDVVVRINRWDTSPRWQPHVGTRTDVWALYFRAWDWVKSHLVESAVRTIWWVEIGNVHAVMAPWRAEWVPWCAARGIELHDMPPATVERCYADLGITAQERRAADKKPTSGVVVLAHALETWPEAEVYVAGYDGYQHDAPSCYWSSEIISPHEVRKVALYKQRAWYTALVASGRVREFTDA